MSILHLQNAENDHLERVIKIPWGRNLGSFSIYEQPKWERIVTSTQVGFRVSIWVRIRVWIRVRIRVWIRVRVRVRLGLYRLFIYRERAL